jgi:hypothetical protein
MAFPSLILLLNSALDLMRANSLIKLIKKRDEIHEQEWKQMIHCYGNIYEKLESLQKEIEVLDIHLHSLQDDVFDVVIKNAGEKKGTTRGPYGPRKKKAIEHKVKNDG